MEAFQIINTTPESVKNYGLCGYKDVNKTGYAEKLDWYAKNKNGVAVIARKGPFKAKADIFLKNGFELVENIPPDFQLLVKKIEKNAPVPVYINNNKILHSRYEKGLYILRADQCPYTVKNVSEMKALAEREFNIQPTIVNITNHREAQQNPSPFGTFALICNGKILSHHPISKTRLGNILRKEL